MKSELYSESELDKYLVQVRRVAAGREARAEKKIRRMYKELADDLNAYVGNFYAKYAGEDDKLNYSSLIAKGHYARFLEEVQIKMEGVYPELKKEVETLINNTYELCYKGMCDGVARSERGGSLKEIFAASKALTPEQICAAVQNPMKNIRLNTVLKRNRRDVIYNIRRDIAVGMSMGDGMPTMARRISRHVEGDYNKAMRIARTESHRITEVGFSDSAERIDRELIESGSEFRMVKSWRTKQDSAVRRTSEANHVEMQNQMVLENEEFELSGGVTARCPGTSGVAAHDCNCRCRASRDMMDDAEFFAETGRHFPKEDNKADNEDKRNIKSNVDENNIHSSSNDSAGSENEHIVNENKNVDYMSKSFRPKYSKDVTSLNIGDREIKTKAVTNSKFKILTDVGESKRSKAVKLTQKLLKDVSSMLPEGFEMPVVAVVDFDAHGLNPSAIAGYEKHSDIVYINSKYDTTKKILDYVNANAGQFANTTQYAPILHELGHKFYENHIKSLAKSKNIEYNKAKDIIDNKIYEYVHSRNDDGKFLRRNLSKYANQGLRDNNYSEIIAECFSAKDENTVAMEILKLIGDE